MQQRGPNKKSLYRFFAVILVVFGLFLIIPSQYEILQARQASDWQPRMAKITESNIKQLGGGRAQDIPRYAPQIRGEFRDSGEAFEVYRVSFGEIGTRERAQHYARQFKEGAIVEVYVSPAEPNKVVLIRDVPQTQMYLLEALGGVAIAIAVWLWRRSRRVSQPMQRSVVP